MLVLNEWSFCGRVVHFVEYSWLFVILVLRLELVGFSMGLGLGLMLR